MGLRGNNTSSTKGIKDFTYSDALYEDNRKTNGILVAASKSDPGDIISTFYTKFTQVQPEKLTVGQWSRNLEGQRLKTNNTYDHKNYTQ